MTHHSKGLIRENTMHYILKLECSEVMQNNCDYMAIFDRLFTIFQ